MNIVVVGGGTAGWLAALYSQRTHPDATVTLIESEDIGILGAGEGSTPSLPSILSVLGIDVADVFRHTGATVKNGIRFTGWNPERDFYYPFPAYAGLGATGYVFPRELSLLTSLSPIIAAGRGGSVNDYDMVWKMSEAGLVPMYDKGFPDPTDVFPNIGVLADFGLHFNARDLAAFLRTVGEARGVRRIEGIVTGVESSPEGDVTALLMGDHTVPADFVFDCSGFARLLIGKHYGAPWRSHSKHLPVNRAIPFFLPMTGDIPPYTEATAMSHGWMWRIPTQDRFGCGYVFDSNRMSDAAALVEIESVIGHEVEPPTVFSFSAGCYETPWVRNVCAIGLSAGFLEPLEATAIWQATTALHRILGDPSFLTRPTQADRDRFNGVWVRETSKIVGFLYLHYLTNRRGAFWENFATDNEPPELARRVMEVAPHRPMYDEVDFDCSRAFAEKDYTAILCGNGVIDPSGFNVPMRDVNEAMYDQIVKAQNDALPMLWTHEEFLSVVTA